MKIESISVCMGAKITGIDLNKPVSNEDKTMINQAFAEHSLLIFKKQDIDIENFKNFGMLFGELTVQHHLLPHTVINHPECLILQSNKKKPQGANYWHTDNSGWGKPSLATILHAKTVPVLGGGTVFSNMYMAAEALSKPLRNFLKNLRAVHDVKKAFGKEFSAIQKAVASKGVDIDEAFKDYQEVTHPIIIKHPVTKREALYISYPYITHIKDLPISESDMILKFLYTHIVRNEFIYRHQWEINDLVIWDNRCLQHYGVNDFYPHERLMYRLNINGDKPIAA